MKYGPWLLQGIHLNSPHPHQSSNGCDAVSGSDCDAASGSDCSPRVCTSGLYELQASDIFSYFGRVCEMRGNVRKIDR